MKLKLECRILIFTSLFFTLPSPPSTLQRLLRRDWCECDHSALYIGLASVYIRYSLPTKAPQAICAKHPPVEIPRSLLVAKR